MQKLLCLLDFVPNHEFNEIIALVYDLKPSIRFVLSDFKKYIYLRNLLHEFNIYTSFSSYQILYDKLDFSYSLEPTNNNENEIHFFYASKSKEVLRRVKEIDCKLHRFILNKISGDFDFNFCSYFGVLLGYPKCCVDEFVALRARESSDYLKNAHNKSNFHSIYANYYDLKRKDKHSLISHYPCSFSCEKTIEYGEKLLSILNDLDEEYYKGLVSNLSETLYYVSNESSIKLIGTKENSCFKFDSFEVYAEDKELIEYFRKSNKIIVNGKVSLLNDDEVVVEFSENSKNHGILLTFE